MFRIDRSSVSYKKDEHPFVLAHAALARPALVSLAELANPQVADAVDATDATLEASPLPAEQEPSVDLEEPAVKVELPDPAELLNKARKEAEEILSAARAEAAGLTAKAALEAEELRARAIEEGNDKGRREGLSLGKGEGIAAYHAAVEDAGKVLKSALGRVEEERAKLLFDVERDCVQLAQEIAQKVLGATFALDENAFPALVRRGLEQIQHDGRVTLRVSPLEYDIFFSQGSGWLSDELRTVAVVADDGLKEGDLILESEIESINAGVRAQMAAIRKAVGQVGGGGA